MEFADALLRVGLEVKGGILREGRLEVRRHQVREVAAHALGHAAFGFAGHPDEERDLQAERNPEEQDEAESDAPIETAPKRTGTRHRRTCSHYPTRSG